MTEVVYATILDVEGNADALADIRFIQQTLGCSRFECAHDAKLDEYQVSFDFGGKSFVYQRMAGDLVLKVARYNLTLMLKAKK